MFRFALVLVAFCPSLLAGEISISGPDGKVRAGRVVTFKVDGVSLSDLARATVDVVPSEGVLSLLPQVSWGGQPLIALQAEPEKETVYKITVTVNHWRRDLDAAIAKATAGQVEPELLAELRTVQAKLELSYPFSSGVGQVTVLGTGPVDPPKPPEPPKPATGPRKVTVLHETSEDAYEMSSLIVDLQSGDSAEAKYLESKGHTVSFLDDDLAAAREVAESAFRQGVPVGEKRPAVVIADESGKVLWAGSLEAVTAAWLVEQIKKYGG